MIKARTKAASSSKKTAKKPAVPVEDAWTFATAECDGMPILFRVRSRKPAKIKTTDYPHLITITWAYEPANDFGLPTQEESALMTDFEELLDPALELAKTAYLTSIVTGDSLREWQWYSRDPDETMKLLTETLTDQEPFPVEFTLRSDPQWSSYGEFNELTGQ